MPRKIANLSVLDSDLAARHKALRPSAERSSPEIDRDFDTLMMATSSSRACWIGTR